MTERPGGGLDAPPPPADETRVGEDAAGRGTIPVIAEQLQVGTRWVETDRVRVATSVREREAVVDEPLIEEQVLVERVPIGRVVDGPVGVRQEGDTLIVPVLEEVPVVVKRLVLKEEVRITKRRVEAHRPQRVTLRAEEATVTRHGGDAADEASAREE